MSPLELVLGLLAALAAWALIVWLVWTSQETDPAPLGRVSRHYMLEKGWFRDDPSRPE